MPKFEVREWEWVARAVQRAVLWVEPAGGQTVARRNAWASLVQDNGRRAERLEVARALERSSVEQRREMAVV
jgi:hypothetical protein